MDITLGARSEISGRYNFVRGADGDVSFDDTEAHAVVTSATEKFGSWWADATHGCKVRELTKLVAATPSQATAMTFDSLSSLERASAITGLQVFVTIDRSNGQPTGRLRRRIRWTTPSGAGGDEQVT